MGLWKYDTFGVSTLVMSLAPPAFSAGNNTFSVDISSSPETIDNFTYSYYVLAILDRSTVTPSQLEKIYSLHMGYRLQVSPAPAVASFTDVPTGHWAFRWVEALKGAGITAGCGGTSFCPDSPVTRAQMAVFLSNALGLYWTY
ncbi:MAG: S-layer homology domain-containing protein [Acidobacteriia bacterium]|nr:S-layer homology domain-containing protein [Terriglobia bacterium]